MFHEIWNLYKQFPLWNTLIISEGSKTDRVYKRSQSIKFVASRLEKDEFWMSSFRFYNWTWMKSIRLKNCEFERELTYFLENEFEFELVRFFREFVYCVL